MFTAPTSLPDDPASLQQLVRAALAEIERLQLMIAGLQRNRFGRRSERLNDEAHQQATEELEQALAEQTAVVQAMLPSPEPSASGTASGPSRSEPAKRNRGSLPADLPRIELVIAMLMTKPAPAAAAHCI